jgi:F-box and WD-40 domain protein 1/11
LKGIVHRRASTAAEDTIYESSPTQRPTTAHPSLNQTRHTGFRHARSFYDADFNIDFAKSHTAQHTSSSNFLAIPGLGDEPPVIPFNSGAAAKASAVMSNDFLARQGLQNRWLHPSTSEDGNDRESGIGITVTVPDLGVVLADGDVLGQDARISRIDFISQLPSELAVHILAYLDAATLAKACEVSRNWNKIAATQQIWRESCLRETGVTYATSSPIQPGSGLGTPSVMPNQDWLQIYRVKNELTRRWKTGKARPVYLHGHTDSIYCLQFDE